MSVRASSRSGDDVRATGPVVAVVWTYNRRPVLEACLAAIAGQSVAPDRIVVVDSASPDDTMAALRARDDVDAIALGANDGMAAAIGAGLDRARALGASSVWFVEDDSRPAPDCLAQGLAFLDAHPDVDIAAPVGAVLRRGRWTWTTSGDDDRSVDFCMLDGALIRASALDGVDPPRRDFFIMLVDVEFPLRLQRSGARCVRVAGMQVEPLRLGAGASDVRWRAYYQSRNHLRMALDLRSPSLLWGFVDRSARQVGWALLHDPQRWRLIGLRLRGAFDALTGRMGRRVEPGEGRPGHNS